MMELIGIIASCGVVAFIAFFPYRWIMAHVCNMCFPNFYDMFAFVVSIVLYWIFAFIVAIFFIENYFNENYQISITQLQ